MQYNLNAANFFQFIQIWILLKGYIAKGITLSHKDNADKKRRQWVAKEAFPNTPNSHHTLFISVA